jgi:hypothetical protein
MLCCYGFILTVYAATPPMRDPTQPSGVTFHSISQSNLQVDAIFISKDGLVSTVVIEGHSFTIGDKVAGATIVAIKANEITLKDERGEFTVSMAYSTVKSPTTKNKDKKDS